MSDGLSFDLDGLLGDIEKVKGGLDQASYVVVESLMRALDAIARDILSAAQINLETQTRSGDLSRSGKVTDVVLSDGKINVSLGFTEVYAAQRDQGGTITAKNGKMLAIPLAPILTATGSRFKSPLEETNLECISILGNVYLVDKTTHEFHWLLTPSVTQKGSYYLTSVVQERQGQVGAVAAQLVKDDLSQGRAA
jgi:hypothetical protein